MLRAPLSLFLCWLLTALSALADAPLRCAVCQNRISGQFFWWQSPGVSTKLAVCESCGKLDTSCAICRIPIRQHGRQLADGRWLCDKDFAAGVFAPADAARIYEEVWRDLQRLLAGTGTLPRQNITVSLVDARELRKQNASLPSEHDQSSIMGLTRTRTLANREWQHHIYLLNGLGQARLAAICAHEYTHTWLHENVPATRGLDRDTVEGFCELVAFKLMVQRHEEVEGNVILANAYTRGQVNAFVQAEAEHQFHRVVRWVKTGVDEVLPESNRTRVLALREDEPAPLTWPPPPPTPTLVPDELLLRGISGNRAHRFVLINDCTLTTNEVGRVRVGTSNVLVRCVAIKERSAVIKIQGRSDYQELFLLGAN